LISPKEALAVGLVDELAESEEEAEKKGKNALLALLKVDNSARHSSKMSIRYKHKDISSSGVS